MKTSKQKQRNTLTVNKVNRLSFCGLLLVTLGLVGCQSNRVISTTDDSAEYKSAKALPPLKKPQPNPVVVSRDEPVSAPEPTPVVVEKAQKAPTVIAPPVEIEQPVSADADDVEVAPSDTLLADETVAVVLYDEDNKTRMRIESDYEVAWGYVTNQLVKSDLTVFTRNKAAGRISIGCAEIGNDAVVEVKRVGGWSIFNRKKAQTSEYCALQALERKGQTVISVLNRAGQEVEAKYGRLVLSRIQSN